MRTSFRVVLIVAFLFSCSLAGCSAEIDGIKDPSGPIVHEHDSAVFADNGRGPKLTVTDFNWRYLAHVRQITVKGDVQNDSGKDLQGCRMLVSAFDQFNNLLGTTESYLDPTYIGSGKIAHFDFYLPHGKWVKAIHLQYRFEIRY